MSEYLQSELPTIELFKKLKYDYFDAKGEMYEVILEDRLTTSLNIRGQVIVIVLFS